MGKYARKTNVSVERSIAEIQRIVTRFGADKFAYMQGKARSEIGFEVRGIAVRLTLLLPDRSEKRFQKTGHIPPRKRTENQIYEAWDLECRRLWRCMAAVVKAKFIAIEDGISTIEREFMADLLMTNGKRLEEIVLPQLADAYATGATPKLLTG